MYAPIPSNSKADTNGFWMFNFMSQILAQKVKFVANYTTLFQEEIIFTSYGRALRNSLDFYFFQKILKDQLIYPFC
jgi:hypothetical protein